MYSPLVSVPSVSHPFLRRAHLYSSSAFLLFPEVCMLLCLWTISVDNTISFRYITLSCYLMSPLNYYSITFP